MAKIIRAVHYHGVQAIVVNVRLWRVTFWEVWNPLPMDQKLAWILFVSNTVAVLSLFEVFLLR